MVDQIFRLAKLEQKKQQPTTTNKAAEDKHLNLPLQRNNQYSSINLINKAQTDIEDNQAKVQAIEANFIVLSEQDDSGQKPVSHLRSKSSRMSDKKLVVNFMSQFNKHVERNVNKS